MTSTGFRELFRERREVFEKGIDSLNKREKKIISLRYGLGADIPLTLEEVGAKIGVSRQRIKQIEDGAYYKLTNNK